jgi:2,5-diketo-D-gluconate reductase B
MTDMQYVDLESMRVPALGLGTWQLQGHACRDAVSAALQLGYRHIDTAAAYGNEAEIGAAIRASGIARDDLWVTSKLWHEDLRPRDVMRSCRDSVKRLGLDRVDLMLVHWPNPDVPLDDTLDAMGRAVDEGLASHIGVSNFTPDMLQQALSIAPLRCIQVEFHPFLRQDALLELARARQLLFTAYCPLARGRVTRDATLQQIGRQYGKSAAQVALRWLTQHPFVAAIPKSTGPEHMAENLGIFDFELDPASIRQINALGRDERLIDPDFAPDWQRR